MKKVGKFLLIITALLCLFVLPGQSSIVSRAAKKEVKSGTLNEGREFNAAIKNLANNSSSMKYSDEDKNIKQVVFLRKNLSKNERAALEKQKKVSVGKNVWAYYSKGKISVFSTADKIICNYDSRAMLYKMSGIQSVDMTMLDFSEVYFFDNIFTKCTNLKEVNLSNINAPKMHSVLGLFNGCENLEKVNFTGFKVDKIFDFDYMFTDCKKLQSIDLSSFKTENATSMCNMFQNCESLKSLNLSNFATPLVHEISSMFENCTSLEYLDMRNFDLNKVIIYDYVFTGCVSLKTIVVPKGTNQVLEFPVLMVLDNDNDGKPDTAETFHKNPVSDRFNRLIAFEGVYSAYAPKADSTKPDIILTEKGVTYRIKPDGTVTVTKIEASGKVEINAITYEGVSYPVIGIEEAACKGNKKIKALIIGKNVISVGKDSFRSCKKLKKITINANKELEVGKDAFKKLNKKAVIKVKGLKGKPKKALVKAIKKQTNADVK